MRQEKWPANAGHFIKDVLKNYLVIVILAEYLPLGAVAVRK